MNNKAHELAGRIARLKTEIEALREAGDEQELNLALGVLADLQAKANGVIDQPPYASYECVNDGCGRWYLKLRN